MTGKKLQLTQLCFSCPSGSQSWCTGPKQKQCTSSAPLNLYAYLSTLSLTQHTFFFTILTLFNFQFDFSALVKYSTHRGQAHKTHCSFNTTIYFTIKIVIIIIMNERVAWDSEMAEETQKPVHLADTLSIWYPHHCYILLKSMPVLGLLLSSSFSAIILAALSPFLLVLMTLIGSQV